MNKKPVYKKVILKISGEALMGSQEHGIDAEMCASLALQIKEIRSKERRVPGYFTSIAAPNTPALSPKSGLTIRVSSLGLSK